MSRVSVTVWLVTEDVAPAAGGRGAATALEPAGGSLLPSPVRRGSRVAVRSASWDVRPSVAREVSPSVGTPAAGLPATGAPGAPKPRPAAGGSAVIRSGCPAAA